MQQFYLLAPLPEFLLVLSALVLCYQVPGILARLLRTLTSIHLKMVKMVVEGEKAWYTNVIAFTFLSVGLESIGSVQSGSVNGI